MTDVSYISPNIMEKQYNREIMDDFRSRWSNYIVTCQNLESLIGKSLTCKNILMDILLVQVTGDSLMMYELH